MSNSEYLKEVAPLPWKIHRYYRRPYLYRLVDAQGLTVLLIPGKQGTGTGDRAKQIAEYVLHAANSHEELLKAARQVNNAYGGGRQKLHSAICALEDAIWKAEEGKS